MKKLLRGQMATAALCAALTLHCANPDAETLENSEGAIYNGQADATEAGTGVVKISGPGFSCTGSLLKNDWMLTAAHCVDADLDWSFGSRGKWTAPVDGDNVRSVVDLGSGYVYGGWAPSGANRVLLVGKANASPGAPDPAFGVSGRAIIDIPGSTSEELLAITVTGNKIIGVGYVTLGGAKQMLIVRLNADGSLDTSFDTNGYKFVDFPFPNETAKAVMMDGSKIVVAGDASDSSHSELALFRVASNGALDTGFGTQGKTTTSQGSGNYLYMGKLARLSTGKIVALGSGTNLHDGWIMLARYTSAGALDTTATIGPGASDGGLAIDSSDRVFVGGSLAGFATIWRLTSTMAVDTTFGSGGTLTPSFWDATADSVIEILNPGGANKMRAVVQLSLGADHRRAVGLSTPFTTAGALGKSRIFPSKTGAVYELPSNAKAVTANYTNVLDFRVIVAGTANSGTSTSRVTMLRLIPDRASYIAPNTTTYPFSGTMALETRDIKEVYLPPGSLDVAVVKLNSGMSMGNPASTTGYVFPGFSAKSAANVPFNVFCRGYGASALNSDGGQIDGGTLRKGISKVTSYDSNYALLGFADSPLPQQLPFKGDSGSSCRDANDGGRFLGVHSRQSNTVAMEVPASAFSTWANTLLGL